MIPISFFFGGGKRTDQTAGHKEGISGSMTIAWDDQFKRQNIMWKVPRNVRMNDNVVVREDEIAVFYRDGKVLAYLDRPDRYALTSQNAPILGRLIQALSGVVQQAEVYYLQKRIFDGKFGTQDAFLFQDPDFDMVQLRAFGDFRYRLKDPETFINQFVGTFGAATSAEVEDRIKGEIVKQLNVTLGKMKANGLKVVDFAASLNDIEQGVLANAKPHFLTLGIEILQISGMNIPLPESIKEALEKMASAKVLGRTNAAAYQQFAFADSMKAAAANPSGGAGTGVGLGAGVGMGYAMGSQMGGMIAPATAADESLPEVRDDEPGHDEVLRELRGRHDRRGGEQALHQVRQARGSGTEVLRRVRRGPDPPMPRRPRGPRGHEVLPGVREARQGVRSIAACRSRPQVRPAGR
jgi:membrane protease subunit (stomatin/prohibitin family)